MVRQRKSSNNFENNNQSVSLNDESHTLVSHNHRSSKHCERRHNPRNSNAKYRYGGYTETRWYKKSIYLLPLSLLVGIVLYFLYLGYMETRVNTPLAVPKVSFFFWCIIKNYEFSLVNSFLGI